MKNFKYTSNFLFVLVLATSWTFTGMLYAQEHNDFETNPPSEIIQQSHSLVTVLGYNPEPIRNGVWNDRLSNAKRFFLLDARPPASDTLTPQGLRHLRELAAEVVSASSEGSNETASTVSSDRRLHRAVIAGDIENVRRLIAAGVDVNARDNRSWTPLMHAANKGYVLLVEILLRAGGLPDIRAVDGATALFIATLNADSEAIGLLMRAGASVSIRGPRGLTAMGVARLVFGDKNGQRPVPDDAEVHALLGGMTWAEAVKQTMVEMKDTRKATQPESKQQLEVEPQGEGQVKTASVPSTGNVEEIEADLALTRAQRISVQRALSDLGFNVGPADGVFGPRTRSAIAAYQRAGELAVTGYLDQDQFYELMAKGEEAEQHQAEDSAAFSHAKTIGTLNSYESYLKDFPSGHYADEAQRLAEKIQAHRLREGCPDISGTFVFRDDHGYDRYLIVDWELTPDSITYLFNRDDLNRAFDGISPSAYKVPIGKSNVLRFEDESRIFIPQTQTIEIIFEGKCSDDKLIVKENHNYDPPYLGKKHPYTQVKSYELLEDNIQRSILHKWHPNDGGESNEWQANYRRLSE